MGENSKIEWTHHTFNPWIGCAKVSPGCAHCYAEELMATRYNRVEWGENGTRVKTGPSNWRKPLKWNREAEQAGERRRVFCASLADVFEGRRELIPWRVELFQLIDATPWLDWLLLTKRPENISRMMPPRVATDRQPIFPGCPGPLGEPVPCVIRTSKRINVWLGTSVENQDTAEQRIPHLLDAPAAVRFLSCEPLLGPINLDLWRTPIDWVIVGGESGWGARKCYVEWVRDIRDQCKAAGAACFVKQLGRFPDAEDDLNAVILADTINDSKGGDWNEWPADLRVREFPR